MKILYENALVSGVFSSVNASANFPASNLVNDFLRVRYQCTALTDSITIALPAAVPVDTFHIGYARDLTAISVTFRLGGVVVGTAPFGDYAGEEFAARHFTAIAAVDEVVLDLTGSTTAFSIGGAGAGVSVDMPSPDAQWEDSFQDNSVVVRSPHGQVQQQYIAPYSRYLFTFVGVTLAKFNQIKAASISVAARPVWVSFFEDSPEVFPPGYYTATLGNPQRTRRDYQFTMAFEEAR